jgi:hypothetical protein
MSVYDVFMEYTSRYDNITTLLSIVSRFTVRRVHTNIALKFVPISYNLREHDKI